MIFVCFVIIPCQDPIIKPFFSLLVQSVVTINLEVLKYSKPSLLKSTPKAIQFWVNCNLARLQSSTKLFKMQNDVSTLHACALLKNEVEITKIPIQNRCDGLFCGWLKTSLKRVSIRMLFLVFFYFGPNWIIQYSKNFKWTSNIFFLCVSFYTAFHSMLNGFVWPHLFAMKNVCLSVRICEK